MPLYEYECTKCGNRFERIQKFSDKSVKTCPKCKGKVQRLLSAPAIQFKGSGWYITDYARKKEGSSEDKSSKSSEDKGGKGEDKPAKDKKPAKSSAKKGGDD